MEKTINKVDLRGNVGADPRMVVLENGARAMKFSLATTEVIKKKDGELKEETMWHNITAWESKNIPDVSVVKKGVYIEVTGKLRYSRYTSQDGVEKNYTEILAQKINLPKIQTV